jgi:hypothetical protein
LNSKLVPKAKGELGKEIKKYEPTDTNKQDAMIVKMIANDYEDYEQAIEILKKLITIKSNTGKPDSVIVAELKK